MIFFFFFFLPHCGILCVKYSFCIQWLCLGFFLYFFISLFFFKSDLWGRGHSVILNSSFKHLLLFCVSVAKGRRSKVCQFYQKLLFYILYFTVVTQHVLLFTAHTPVMFYCTL